MAFAKINKITHNKKLVATIITPILSADRSTFLTEEDQLLQVGFHNYAAGHTWKPHTHPKKTTTLDTREEVLYVTKGTIRVSFFTNNGDCFKKVDVHTGDVVILHALGHGLEALTDCEIFEVKQGPYAKTNKKFFDDHNTR